MTRSVVNSSSGYLRHLRRGPCLVGGTLSLCTFAVCIDNRVMSKQRKAYLDPTFLKSEDARPLRILAEYLDPLRRFKEQDIQDTVVFFGSARIHSRERAQVELHELMRQHCGRAGSAIDPNLRLRKCVVQCRRCYAESRPLTSIVAR